MLLGYLPFADDETVAEEVRNSLAAMAIEEGQAHKSIVAALADKLPARRAAAAEALLQAGITNEKDALQSSSKIPTCRYACGWPWPWPKPGKEAVPVLIDLLAKRPRRRPGGRRNAAPACRRQGATLVLGDDAATRQKCARPGAAWWKDQGPKRISTNFSTCRACSVTR